MSSTAPARKGTRNRPGVPGSGPWPTPAGQSVRADQRELFVMRLRTELSRRGTPYSSRTIGAYLDAVDSLGRWMTSVGHRAGFDALTHSRTQHLPGHLPPDARGQNETVTKQQNLRVFLRFLSEEYDAADLWVNPKRARYQRPLFS